MYVAIDEFSRALYAAVRSDKTAHGKALQGSPEHRRKSLARFVNGRNWGKPHKALGNLAPGEKLCLYFCSREFVKNSCFPYTPIFALFRNAHMEKTNSIGLLLNFARPCRYRLSVSMELAVLGVTSGMVPYFVKFRSLLFKTACIYVCQVVCNRVDVCLLSVHACYGHP